MLKDLLQKQVDCFAEECDEWLDAEANARLVKDAEAYYRVMYYGSAESWNLRDTHMFEALNMILRAKGPDSKAIAWAHNSHIGNAAFTGMGLERFIGVIYRPETERWSHYSEAILPRQFDAWVWFDETEAVIPLPAELRPGEAPSVEETYPFGL